MPEPPPAPPRPPATPPANARGRAACVLIPCDNRQLGGHPFYVLGRKYADAVREAARCLPLIVPTGEHIDVDPYLDLVDGIVLTGSPANVHPSHFGQDVHDPALPLDTGRDAVTLPLVRKAIERGLPLLAICRGLQEINVALGGSLHQAIHRLPDRRDHRGREGSPEEQYGPAHDVEAVAGGLLASFVGTRRFIVNSVHGQGIDRLAAGLAVEATADDGTIEAVRILAHPGFSLALQWHPEWRATENPVSMAIFAAFGDACRAARGRRP
ncbi:MAG TPA: gamma-glutamyl-gamma-aminobutyrate hydrolase family protein [Burkholderiaceae bacterium]|nr:gamma-glutamyl-gamma-aminobutyrate hydrolase family protein [Burkholderiaceae bacterium]